MLVVTCVCGRKFNTYPSRIKQGRGKFCSRRCLGLSHGPFVKGHTINSGRKQSLETKIKRGVFGQNEKNPNWKGETAKYRTIHTWIQSKLGKASYCENNPSHKSTRYHWANISGEYKRDISDWHSLCPHCNLSDGVHIPSRFQEGRVVRF